MRRSVAIAIALIIFTVTLRLLPHPDNFAPLTALAVFAGAVLPRRFAAVTPLLAAIISDAIIGFYGPIMLAVWASYAVIGLVSQKVLRHPNFVRGGLMTVAGSITFFITSNLAVWIFSAMYSHTLTGLLQCFTLAIPFFRNSLLGDLIYVTILFGLYNGAIALSKLSVREEGHNV